MFATIVVEVGPGERWSANIVRKEITVTAPEVLPKDSQWWAKLCAGLVTSAIYEAESTNDKDELDDG